jgi:hypothetical protein
VSVEDRARLARVDELRARPAAVRFLSFEPLLEDLGPLDLHGIDWVIVGGESGPAARPMHPDRARRVRDQCVTAGVPFFFKQWGEWMPAPEHMNFAEAAAWVGARRFEHHSSGHTLVRVGKKNAGGLLDGVQWHQFPAATTTVGSDHVVLLNRKDLGPPSTSLPPNAVYIGRRLKRAGYDLPESKWHNPFKVGRDGTLDQVLAKYRERVVSRPDLMASLPELEGKLLVCWCAPKPCHGDVLIELLATLPAVGQLAKIRHILCTRVSK